MGLFHRRTYAVFLLLLPQIFSINVPIACYRRPGYYKLVLEWPGSYCNRPEKCCLPPTAPDPNDFHIHGLWPTWENGGWPEFCDPNRPWDFSKVADLELDLQQKWYSLECLSDNQNANHNFWRREWIKHGTCAWNLDEYNYFSSALDLRSRINLLDALGRANILPNGQEYNLGEVLAAIRAEINNHVPEIRCNGGPHGELQLWEVRICVDETASQIVDCDITPQNGCPSEIVFPPPAVLPPSRGSTPSRGIPLQAGNSTQPRNFLQSPYPPSFFHRNRFASLAEEEEEEEDEKEDDEQKKSPSSIHPGCIVVLEEEERKKRKKKKSSRRK